MKSSPLGNRLFRVRGIRGICYDIFTQFFPVDCCDGLPVDKRGHSILVHVGREARYRRNAKRLATEEVRSVELLAQVSVSCAGGRAFEQFSKLDERLRLCQKRESRIGYLAPVAIPAREDQRELTFVAAVPVRIIGGMDNQRSFPEALGSSTKPNRLAHPQVVAAVLYKLGQILKGMRNVKVVVFTEVYPLVRVGLGRQLNRSKDRLVISQLFVQECHIEVAKERLQLLREPVAKYRDSMRSRAERLNQTEKAYLYQSPFVKTEGPGHIVDGVNDIARPEDDMIARFSHEAEQL